MTSASSRALPKAPKEAKRLLISSNPFSLTDIIFTRKSRDTLAFIDSCEIIDHYHAIRQDMEKTLIASYFIDLTGSLQP